jgi:hypothetical protein
VHRCWESGSAQTTRTVAQHEVWRADANRKATSRTAQIRHRTPKPRSDSCWHEIEDPAPVRAVPCGRQRLMSRPDSSTGREILPGRARPEKQSFGPSVPTHHGRCSRRGFRTACRRVRRRAGRVGGKTAPPTTPTR